MGLVNKDLHPIAELLRAMEASIDVEKSVEKVNDMRNPLAILGEELQKESFKSRLVNLILLMDYSLRKDLEWMKVFVKLGQQLTALPERGLEVMVVSATASITNVKIDESLVKYFSDYTVIISTVCMGY